MGWDAINNTASRQRNLDVMARSTENLKNRKTQLETTLRDLAATSEAINHLVDGTRVSFLLSGNQRFTHTGEALIRQLGNASSLVARENDQLRGQVRLAERFAVDYEKVRNERPSPKLSGRAMASTLSGQSRVTNLNRAISSRMLALAVPTVNQFLELTQRTQPRLSESDLAAMRNFVSTYRR